MVQLLIYENYIMRQRIFYYIIKLSQYIDNCIYTNDVITFLNNIYTLPKLDTFLSSNIANLASNNSETFPFLELMKLKPPDNINEITIKINKTYVNVIYNNILKQNDKINQAYFKTKGYSETEITYTAEPFSKDGNEHKKTDVKIDIKLPCTIQCLINLHDFLQNSTLNDEKNEIKNRIYSFFKDNIDSLNNDLLKFRNNNDDNEIETDVYGNIDELLAEVGLNDADIQHYDITNDYDEEDCDYCADDGTCINNTNTSKMNVDSGGTRKNKRKQPKKYKSYNRKNKTKTNRKSKSKKHNKSKNKRKPNKTQRKHKDTNLKITP
jgi:hypothetical protein